MTTRIGTYDTFEKAVDDLVVKQGYRSSGQDNQLGHLFTKDHDTFRLVKNDFTGNKRPARS
jgi:hypothetical protein